jgi:mono/diheme cytochrome c family protein
LLVEVGTIDARLLDDEAAVAARLAAIEAGSPEAADAEPVLTADELTLRQTALANNVPNRLRALSLELNGDGTAENPSLLEERQAILDSFSTATSRGYLPQLAPQLAELEAGSLTPLEFTNYLSEEANRLAQVSWGGTQEGYILTTLIHGRPGSNLVWPGPMVSWSQRGGGPLRDDEIRDIIAYIMNWNKGDNWTLTDLNNVQQFARLHSAYSPTPPEDPTPLPPYDPTMGPMECTGIADCVGGTGTVAEIVTALPVGDASAGAGLYSSLGCAGCHLGGAIGPDIAGTFARIEGERLLTAEHEGIFNADQYLVASILYPNAYVPSPYSSGLMPATFGTQLTAQDLANLVAYIKAQ